MAESRVKASPQIALDVIAAPATPPGQSAVGMIRLSGAGCVRIAGSCIRFPRHELAPRVATLAKAYNNEHLLDQVVLTYFPGPSSYTGEDTLEICAHGSPYILSTILELLIAAGARPAEPGEFTQRAYINGRMDLAQAEAVCDLIQAKTRFAHRAALSQLEGGLSTKVTEFRSEILDLLAAVEAELDHPDEDLPALSGPELRSGIERLSLSISTLANTHRTGRLYRDGMRIAIVGRPNVGKSSLLNAFLGRERAIVSEIPGTTRDTLEEWADLDGLQALFIDTAGLRDKAADSVEHEGIARTHKALATCDLALLVLDRSRALEPEDLQTMQEVAAICDQDHRPVIVVLNKADLKPFPDVEHPSWESVAVSALNGSGLQNLIHVISRKMMATHPTEEGSMVITSLRHRRSLEQAEVALKKAYSSYEQSELAALHLREALVALAGIVGETTSEDILKSIFSKFCIGK